jgi:phage replication initiation protein
MDSFYLFDWITFTTKSHDLEEVKELLGLEHAYWEEGSGRYCYKESLWYEHISIYYNGRDDMGICCEMSGKGCRAFESYGHGCYESLFKVILNPSNEINVTRLDIAFDDHDGLLDLDKIVRDTQLQNYTAEYRKYKITQGTEGTSIVHGKRISPTMIRIYDKAAERGYDKTKHWVRVELQLKRERAKAFIERYMEDETAVSRTFRGTVFNYLRYTEPSKTDTNKRRWKTAKYWQKFIDGAEKVTLWKKPGVEYNLSNLESFAINQAGGAIRTLIKINGLVPYLQSIFTKEYNNPKYQRLIEKYGEAGDTKYEDRFFMDPDVIKLFYMNEDNKDIKRKK